MSKAAIMPLCDATPLEHFTPVCYTLLYMSRILSVLTLLSIASTAIVVVGSWIICAIDSGCGLRPLLTAEGVRWFVGDFTSIVCSDVLVWILVAAMAWGVVRGSGVVKALHAALRRPLSLGKGGDVTAIYTERVSLNISLAVAAAIIAIFLYFSLAPHAVLRGATGNIVGSAAAFGLLPAVCLATAAASATYGLLTSRFRTFFAIFTAMADGINKAAQLAVAYFFIAILIRTVQYIWLL